MNNRVDILDSLYPLLADILGGVLVAAAPILITIGSSNSSLLEFAEGLTLARCVSSKDHSLRAVGGLLAVSPNWLFLENQTIRIRNWRREGDILTSLTTIS